MSIFVDASALVAITKGEPERDALLDRFTACNGGLWSRISCWEAMSAVARSYDMPIDEAMTEVSHTALILQLKLVDLGRRERDTAVVAYAPYGKRSGHPAKLNMGDCFAYACAKTKGARLLYKGDDFARTDLA